MKSGFPTNTIRGTKKDIVWIEPNNNNFAFAWSRVLIGKDERVDAPVSSMFKNPEVSIIEIIGWYMVKTIQIKI